MRTGRPLKLTPAQITRIHRLVGQGWSHDRIADELKVHRNTVSNYLRRGDDNPAPRAQDPVSFWVAMLPHKTGWGVFATRSGYDDWHKLVAVFSDEKRAQRYASSETASADIIYDTRPDEIEGPKEGIAPLPNFAKRGEYPVHANQKTIGDRILANLDAWFAAEPKGVTSNHIMRELNASYAETLAALRWLHRRELARWLRSGDGAQKRLFPITVDPEQRKPTLTERVLTLLLTQCEATNTNRVAIGYRQIAKMLDMSRGSINYAIIELTRRGHLKVIERGSNRGRPNKEESNYASTYEVSATPDYKDENRQDPPPDDDDLHPNGQARFETALRAAARIPPKDEEERALRQEIADDMDKRSRKSKTEGSAP